MAPAATSPSTTAEEVARAEHLERNKRLVEGFFRDVFGAHDADAAARYLRPDYIQHNPQVPGGLEGFQKFFRPQFAKISPERRAASKLEVLHVVADGDLVAIHLRYSGISAAGKRIEVTEFDLFRIEGDRIAEHWVAIPPAAE